MPTLKSKPFNFLSELDEAFAGLRREAMACEQLSLRAALVELDPKYCDVIVARWEEFTGQKGVLENASR